MLPDVGAKDPADSEHQQWCHQDIRVLRGELPAMVDHHKRIFRRHAVVKPGVNKPSVSGENRRQVNTPGFASSQGVCASAKM